VTQIVITMRLNINLIFRTYIPILKDTRQPISSFSRFLCLRFSAAGRLCGVASMGQPSDLSSSSRVLDLPLVTCMS
jgi:hypothetical protein